MRALARRWGALLALALFLVAGLAALDDYGVHWDEFAQRQNAERNLRYLADGDVDAYTSGLWVDHEKFYGMAFEVPLLLIERAFGIDGDPRAVNLSRHLHSRLLFLAGGLFAYLLALRLFGSRLLALFAMGFFLLHPRLYGHSFFNSKDIPFLAMFIVALFLTHRAFRRDGVAVFALLGVGVGVLVNLRIMGVVLLAAVPAMRALDLALASGWAERKRVLLTTGAFALGAALTIYALLPYLWADPVGRTAEWWSTFSDPPNVISELFRGTLYRNVDFPVEYLPVWFSITSPPFALLLGAVGAGGALVAAVRAPRAALRNGRLRFGLLLVGCFALPVLAVMPPGGNIFNGWRHMYFLWASFALLAVFGLHRLAGALGRWRLRTAVYGAAGAGFAATVISMALIHPNEDVYFNLLTDRVTPDHLRWQYPMAYWDHTVRQGLEWVVKRSAQSSDGPRQGTANRSSWVSENALVLPESARERLANAAPFTTAPGRPAMSWARSARELHRVEVYENTLWTVESQDDLRGVYESVHGREPAVDGAFDVHRLDGALALVMEPCAPAFVERRGWLTVRAFPVDPADLPPWRRGEAFDLRRFWLADYGAHFDGKCVASLPLPAYPVADFELRWPQPELLDAGEAREKARRAREQGRLLASVEYDIYLADGELVYVNDACDPLDTEHPFELIVRPERAQDLPEALRKQGYEWFGLYFHRSGAFVDGGCVAFFPLPDYPVASIRTGQSIEGGELWRAGFTLNAEPYRLAYEAAVSGEPLARGAFDVHMADGTLVYVKEPCEQGDMHARFFLHIVPERADDLPEERRESGFDNLDFDFFLRGALFDGRCAARVPLPGYPIASVRTGQHASGAGELWRAEFAVGR